MPFLGNEPSNTFVSIAKQTITGNGGTSYALSYPVASANDIDVFYNNVRQEPGVAYTASGSTIAFTEAIASTDSVYILYNGQAIGTVNAPAGAYLPTTGGTLNGELSVNNRVVIQQDSTSYNRLTLRGKPSSSYRWNIDNFDSANTLRIFRENDSDGSAGAVFAQIDSAGRVTTPYQPSFSVGFSTSYTQLSGVRDVQFNYKNFDVGTNFNTSTYRFTAPVAGKYLFSAFVGTNGGAPANTYFGIGFVVNGSSQGLCWYNSSSGYQKDAIIQLLNLSANDYVLVHMEVQNNTTLNTGNFSGYLLG
jgi:C1q domain